MTAGQVAVVTGVGAGSLGEAIARGLRDLGFRVLTSTRTCPTTDDTHALELTSRESVAAFAALGFVLKVVIFFIAIFVAGAMRTSR